MSSIARQRVFSVSCLAGLCLLLFSAAHVKGNVDDLKCSKNLVVNGDFEDHPKVETKMPGFLPETLPGWQSSSNIYLWANSEPPVLDGDRGKFHYFTFDPEGIWQNFMFPAGTRASVTMKVGRAANEEPKCVVKIGPPDDLQIGWNEEVSKGWHELQFAYVVPKDSNMTRLHLLGNSCFYDDVSLKVSILTIDLAPLNIDGGKPVDLTLKVADVQNCHNLEVNAQLPEDLVCTWGAPRVVKGPKDSTAECSANSLKIKASRLECGEPLEVTFEVTSEKGGEMQIDIDVIRDIEAESGLKVSTKKNISVKAPPTTTTTTTTTTITTTSTKASTTTTTTSKDNPQKDETTTTTRKKTTTTTTTKKTTTTTTEQRQAPTNAVHVTTAAPSFFSNHMVVGSAVGGAALLLAGAGFWYYKSSTQTEDDTTPGVFQVDAAGQAYQHQQQTRAPFPPQYAQRPQPRPPGQPYRR